MKLLYKLIFSFVAAGLLFAACNKDVLNRPPLTQPVDDNFWRNETDIRLFANGFYTQYFTGYNSAWGVDYTPARGYTLSVDLTSRTVHAHFESTVPSSRGASTEGAAWLTQSAGPNWNFAWVRKANTFLDLLENVAKPNLDADSYNHWLAVARFFRGF